jgi:hypothetical protein
MYAGKSRLISGALMVLVLGFPQIADAHAGGGMGHGAGGMGHGGMGNGGMGHGGMHHHWHGWGWSWGVPWDWWYYPSAYDNSGAAWQEGYSTAVQEAQWYASQQRQAELKRLRQAQPAPEGVAKAQARRQVVHQAPAVAPVSATPEERAAGKFKLAMLLANDGKTADAAEFAADIVAKYAGTPGAAQAQAFLDNLKRPHGR